MSKASCSAGKGTVDALWMPTVPGVGVTPEMRICAQDGPAVALNLMIVAILSQEMRAQGFSLGSLF